MMDFVREAGWPIYPVLSLGVGGLALALRHVARPSRALVPLALGLAAAALAMGAFGATVGLQTSIRGVIEAPGVGVDRWIVWIGMKEALQSFAAGTLLGAGTVLLVGIGSYRERVMKIG